MATTALWAIRIVLFRSELVLTLSFSTHEPRTIILTNDAIGDKAIFASVNSIRWINVAILKMAFYAMTRFFIFFMVLVMLNHLQITQQHGVVTMIERALISAVIVNIAVLFDDEFGVIAPSGVITFNSKNVGVSRCGS